MKLSSIFLVIAILTNAYVQAMNTQEYYAAPERTRERLDERLRREFALKSEGVLDWRDGKNTFSVPKPAELPKEHGKKQTYLENQLERSQLECSFMSRRLNELGMASISYLKKLEDEKDLTESASKAALALLTKNYSSLENKWQEAEKLLGEKSSHISELKTQVTNLITSKKNLQETNVKQETEIQEINRRYQILGGAKEQILKTCHKKNDALNKLKSQLTWTKRLAWTFGLTTFTSTAAYIYTWYKGSK